MTLPRYRALRRHWERWPPVEMLLAAALGVKPPEPPQDLGALVEMLGTGTFG